MKTGFDFDHSKPNNILTQQQFNDKIQNHVSAYIVNRYDFYEVVIIKGFALLHTERYLTYAEAFNRCFEVNQ